MSDPIFTRFRNALAMIIMNSRRIYYSRFWGMHIGSGSRISLTAKLDLTYPRGIYIGKDTIVTFGVAVLTHDFVHQKRFNTRIGDYCFIGARSIILPGVTIGNHCVVGSGSVVTRDVPDRTIVAGNPARVLRENIKTASWGIMAENEIKSGPIFTDHPLK